MIRKSFIMKNNNGLHARPAAQLVQLCSKFSSEIMLEKGNSVINGKSIIGVMGLGVALGEEFAIIIEGDDENLAMIEIEKYIENIL